VLLEGFGEEARDFADWLEANPSAALRFAIWLPVSKNGPLRANRAGTV
jgi:hypothetical protein